MAAGANEQNYADEERWDGDDLVDLGVGFLEVGGTTEDPPLQDQGVALVVKENWQVQGLKDSNPLKKIKKIKMPSQQLSKKEGHHLQEKPAWVVESCLKSKKWANTTTFKEVKINECLQEPSRTDVQSVKPSVRQAKVKKRTRKSYPQVKNGRYMLDWWKCYLDSCASYNTFFVKEFLRDITEGLLTMSGSCNAGTVLLQKKGWYKNFQVWLNEKDIVNLLSISMLEDAGYKVSTHTDRDWEVTTPQGKVIVFKRDTGVCKGMPYIDLHTKHEGHVMIETMKNNIKGFTKKEAERVKLSRVVQRRIGHPTSEHIKEIVSQPCITNVPIRASDVATAKAIFGPQISGLKGKTIRKKSRGFAVERVSIPDDFYRLNKFVVIAADVMFMAGIPFFVTHLRKIKFTTAEYLPLRTTVQLHS